jgi:hypothetical protein
MTAGLRPSRRARRRRNQPPLPPPADVSDSAKQNQCEDKLIGVLHVTQDHRDKVEVGGRNGDAKVLTDSTQLSSPALNSGVHSKVVGTDKVLTTASTTVTQPLYHFIQACCEDGNLLETKKNSG